MKWSVATNMLELSNISNVPFEIQSILAGDTGRLSEFFRQTGLAGIELNLYEDWEPAAFPPEWIHGVHLRLGELVVWYFLVGGFALLLERRAGQIAAQRWEFYAVTATLFITLAFPGFVYRYLLRRHG